MLVRTPKMGSPFCLSCDIYTYLELAYHDEQNDGKSFKLQAGIAELWRFKAQKVKKLHDKNHLAIFKPGLWQTGFFRCGKEWYHFQQELMMSKMIVELFS